MLFENLGKSVRETMKEMGKALTTDQVEINHDNATKNLKTDFEALKAYNSEMSALTFSNESLSQEQMMNRASTTLQGASDDAKAYAAGKTNVDVDSYKTLKNNAINETHDLELGATKSAKALDGLKDMAGNVGSALTGMLTTMAISAAISGIVMAADYFINYTENTLAAVDQLNEEAQGLRDEATGLGEELDKTAGRIFYLQGLEANGTISLAEASELENLNIDRSISLQNSLLFLRKLVPMSRACEDQAVMCILAYCGFDAWFADASASGFRLF